MPKTQSHTITENFAGQFFITTKKERAHWKPFSLLPICAHFLFRFGCNRPVFGKEAHGWKFEKNVKNVFWPQTRKQSHSLNIFIVFSLLSIFYCSGTILKILAALSANGYIFVTKFPFVLTFHKCRLNLTINREWFLLINGVKWWST